MVYGLPCCLKVYVKCRLYGLRCVMFQGLHVRCAGFSGLTMCRCSSCEAVSWTECRVIDLKISLVVDIV